MVFGFGKKEIEVTIGKYSYSPGETITGKVVLDIKKPAEARELRVALRGEARTRTVRGGRTQHNKSNIYNFQMPLDGEKLYTGGEYSFEIKIPANILNLASTALGGVIGEAIKAARFLSGTHESISWYVQAILDRPMRGDIESKKVQIVIT